MDTLYRQYPVLVQRRVNNYKRQIDAMHKNDRALFDNVVLVPVLAHALRRMQEFVNEAQWARALAEKCKSENIDQSDIDDRPHAAAQKLLYGDGKDVFERMMSSSSGTHRGACGGMGPARDDGEDDY